jgi:hypothetical protein
MRSVRRRAATPKRTYRALTTDAQRKSRNVQQGMVHPFLDQSGGVTLISGAFLAGGGGPAFPAVLVDTSAGKPCGQPESCPLESENEGCPQRITARFVQIPGK